MFRRLLAIAHWIGPIGHDDRAPWQLVERVRLVTATCGRGSILRDLTRFVTH